MTRSRLFFGVVFIALGALLLAGQAGGVTVSTVIADWWPTVVIFAGLARVVAPPRTTMTGVFFMIVGGVLLMWTHGVIESLSLLWPVLIIALGGVLLVRKPGRPRAELVADGEITVVLSDRNARAAPGPLKTATVTTVLGDVDLDLRDVVIDGEAAMRVVCVLGDVDLMVPEHWRVVVSGPEILASVTTEPPAASAIDGPQLSLDVVAVLGDVAVRRVALTDSVRS